MGLGLNKVSLAGISAFVWVLSVGLPFSCPRAGFRCPLWSALPSLGLGGTWGACISFFSSLSKLPSGLLAYYINFSDFSKEIHYAIIIFVPSASIKHSFINHSHLVARGFGVVGLWVWA